MGQENQNLLSSPQTQTGKRPKKWEERFLIKRIGEEDIEIGLDERNSILRTLLDGQQFIQVGKFTLFLNGIKSIDPKWGARNIPPRPKPEHAWNDKEELVIINQAEMDEWDKLFSQSLRIDKHI